MQCLTQISQLQGFSGSIDKSPGASASIPNIKALNAMSLDEPHDAQINQTTSEDDTKEDLEEEEEEEDDNKQISSALIDLLCISDDS
jgi:hypothetical protein